MNKQTEQRFSQLQVLLAKQYDANEGNVMQGKYFSITGPQESKFIDAIQARSDFLQKINLIPVTDIAGEKVLAGAQKTITGRKKRGVIAVWHLRWVASMPVLRLTAGSSFPGI
ncbi:P2 family phage major capsid protein [Edwardsiella tarda]